MNEAALGAVEQMMPYLIFRRTVHCVARKGLAHGREMHPYLMRSAGFESESQQAVFVARI